MGAARRARTLCHAAHIRYVRLPGREPALPVCGKIAVDEDGGRRFVIDRAEMVERMAIDELLSPGPQAFLVRNGSQRLGLLLRPGLLAHVDPTAQAGIGDLVFLVRRDGSAEAAVVVGDGLGPLKSRMYNPDDEIAIGDRQLAAIFRICAVILR